MARGRMIDQGFTRSDKLNSIPRDARLVYASILTTLDREGRTCAEPLVLKVNVFRKSDFTVEEIITAVAQLANVGLIRLYADRDNDAILEYTRFLDFNSPNSRERASEYPAPDSPEAMPLRDPDLKAACEAPGHPTDNADAPTRTTPQPPTDNARALHVQGQRDVQGNVNGTRTLTENENEKHSSTSQAAHAPTLAATPPRARTHDPGQFMEAWNQHRGRLPAVTTMNTKRKGAIRALVKEHGPDTALDLFRDAVRAVARDDFWLERQYGLDTLLTGNKILQRAEQWRNGTIQLGPANTKLAGYAATVASAIGGLDDQPN